MYFIDDHQSTDMIGGKDKNARAFEESQKQKPPIVDVYQPHVRVPGHDENACLALGAAEILCLTKKTLTHCILSLFFL